MQRGTLSVLLRPAYTKVAGVLLQQSRGFLSVGFVLTWEQSHAVVFDWWCSARRFHRQFVLWQLVLACGKVARGTVVHCVQRLQDGWVVVRAFELELLRSFCCGVPGPVD